MSKYRIILADDHELFREGLKSLISKEEDFEVVAQAGNGEILLDQLKKHPCDLVILDLSMPQMDGMAALKHITKKHKKIKVLVLTMLNDHEHFKHAILNGACGYLLKDDAYEQLILALKYVSKGKQYVSSSVATIITERVIRSMDEAAQPSLDILTKREKEILKHISNGLPNKQVASKLNISVRTVETHRANLNAKLGIKTTAGLVKFAIAKGLA